MTLGALLTYYLANTSHIITSQASHCIGATIRIGREIRCLPYAGFLGPKWRHYLVGIHRDLTFRNLTCMTRFIKENMVYTSSPRGQISVCENFTKSNFIYDTYDNLLDFYVVYMFVEAK